MRIMTYNIRGWRTIAGSPNLDAVTAVLKAIDADLVALNEVFYPRVIGDDPRPALEVLAARLDMHFVFGPCLRWPAQDDMPADAYGNALLSRWPIVASAAHHLTSKEEDPQQLLAKREQRGLLEGRIVLPGGQTFTAYVTHLDHKDEGARSLQLRIARTWLGRDRNRPHVVMGDFNAVSPWELEARGDTRSELAASPVTAHVLGDAKGPQVISQMEKAGYLDLYRRFEEPGRSTFIPAEAPIRIDFIFASRTLAESATSCQIWELADDVSDHRPLVADLDLDTAQKGATGPDRGSA